MIVTLLVICRLFSKDCLLILILPSKLHQVVLPYALCSGSRRPILAATSRSKATRPQRSPSLPVFQVVSNGVLDLSVEEAVEEGHCEALKQQGIISKKTNLNE